MRIIFNEIYPVSCSQKSIKKRKLTFTPGGPGYGLYKGQLQSTEIHLPNFIIYSI